VLRAAAAVLVLVAVAGSVPVLPVPTTKRDSKGNGWQGLVDDQQRPFASQGQCIRFVASR
jgi:hypothetical protein